jgi:DNA-binding MarR family transcriptional regulator
MSATGRYCQMYAEWKRVVPETLADVDPGILSRFLTHASKEAGVSRSELEHELGLKQPKISKLSRKFLNERWIEIVDTPQGDGRVEFIRTTSMAKKVMANLEDMFSALSPSALVARSAMHGSSKLRIPKNANGSLI